MTTATPHTRDQLQDDITPLRACPLGCIQERRFFANVLDAK